MLFLSISLVLLLLFLLFISFLTNPFCETMKAAFRRENKQCTEGENCTFLIYRAHMVLWGLRKHLEDNLLSSQRLTISVIFTCVVQSNVLMDDKTNMIL